MIFPSSLISIWKRLSDPIPQTLEHVLIGEVVTGVFSAESTFFFRLRSQKVLKITPCLGFAWFLINQDDPSKTWIKIPGRIRIDRLEWIRVRERDGLTLECTGMVSSIRLKLVPDRSGIYRLVFPDLFL